MHLTSPIIQLGELGVSLKATTVQRINDLLNSYETMVCYKKKCEAGILTMTYMGKQRE